MLPLLPDFSNQLPLLPKFLSQSIKLLLEFQKAA
jgi:hypothetical protein